MKKFNIKAKYKGIAIIIIATLGIFISSCEDDKKNFLNDFEKGGFVRFSEPFPAVVGVNAPANLVLTFTVEAPDENVVSYTMEVSAVLSGVEVGPFPIGTEVTSFPATIKLTAQNFAEALGIDVSDINFGDTFSFIATSVNNKGVEYSGERIDFDTNSKVISGGNNSNDLLDQDGYRNAFIFSFSIACPTYNAVNVPGTYKITVDDFEGFLDDGVFQIIAGPGANQFTMVDIFGHPEMYNIIINIDPNTGNITVAKQAAWNCANFGCDFGVGSVNGTGLAFTCIGTMTFFLEHTVSAGSFGSYALKVKKLN